MYILKGCPKCRGDMYLRPSKPEIGEAHCIQCGHREYGQSMTLVKLLRPEWPNERQSVPRAA